ncbi:hypothetical protein M758_5G103500 [Ceratodon purpureus]|nr:hypothetical protein M758_5G103500 [Ceratodon purpureus]
MFLLGFVNSTFETRRPTGHLELVNLSLEKAYHSLESRVESRVKELGNHLGNEHLQNGSTMTVSFPNANETHTSTMTLSFPNGNETHTSTKSENGNKGAALIVKPSIARPRRPSVEDLPADLYMEPLHPLILRSPDGRKMPVYVLEKDIAASQEQDLDQEWSFWNLAQDECQDASRMTTISEITLGSVFADGGVSTRVQHHPLEMTEEDQDSDSDSDSDLDSNSESKSESDRPSRSLDTIAEKSSEEVGRDDSVQTLAHADEGFDRILQHLQRIEGSVKDLKARVDDAKLRIEQSEQEVGALPRDSEEADCVQATKVLPSLSPSLSSPVMEKMGSVASPELPYSWNMKLNPNPNPTPPKLPVKSEPVMEERDLRRYSPPLADSDVQDVLSFRLWEQESSSPPKPKRRPRKSSVSRAFEELDLEKALDLVADEYAMSKDLKLPLPNSGLRRYRGRNAWDNASKDDDSTDAASTENVESTATKKPSSESVESTATRKPSPRNFDALLNLKTLDLRMRRADQADGKVDVKLEVKRSEEAESQLPEDFNPSPSSFTCGLSPTSLFSDDQESFQMSVSIDENMFLKNFKTFSGGRDGSNRKSPRSVLSPEDEEPDEVSRSDSSESREEDPQQRAVNSSTYLYNDDSSDLESPMKAARNVDTTAGFAHRPFPTFTYSIGNEMGETSSSEEDQDDASTTFGDACDADLAELDFFQEAATSNHWEPWLVKDDDGVLDDSDLEFLLSPDFKTIDITKSIVAFDKGKTSPVHTREQQTIRGPASEVVNSKMVDQKTKHGSPRRPQKWVPYVTSELHGSGASPVRSPARGGSRHASEVFVASLPRAGGDKTTPKSRPPKRSVNFAADLVKEIPHSPGPSSDKRPAPSAMNPRAKPNLKRHGDNESMMSPGSSKKWEVEEGPSIMTSRSRWRKNREASEVNSPGESSRGSSRSLGSRSGSRRQKVAEAVPCAGKLFSWPQRLSFKVSRGKGPMESDDESFAGDRSFGTSARRDAEQVRRILKGSQKRYSNLSVAEIMKQDFSK